MPYPARVLQLEMALNLLIISIVLGIVGFSIPAIAIYIVLSDEEY